MKRSYAFIIAAFAMALPATAVAAPTVSLSAPANNASYVLPATVTISAKATASTGTTVTQVEFYAGSTLIDTDTTSPYSVVWSSPTAGSHSLTAKAYDSTGAVTTSAARTVSVSATNTPPTVSVSAPANNASFVSPASITVSATAKAPETNDAVVRVEFYAGATPIGTDTTRPYSISWANPPVGSHSLTARAYDRLGGVTTSAARTVKVNTANTPPTVSLSAPANGSSFVSPSSITVSANAKAPETNDTVVRVEFYAGATPIGTDTASPYSIRWANPPVGSHSLTARAYDGLGGMTTSSARMVTVTASNVPPSVSLTTPADGSSHTEPASITLTASASDSNGISKVEFYNGTTWLGTDTTSPYSWALTNVAAGSYSYTVRAFDTLGASTTSAAVNVTVNAAPVRTETITYYHNDALGSPIAATDATGALLWRESYRPYGERLNNPSASGNNPIWYTGKRQDPETGLVYMGSRYYNPMLGRFLSIDPIEPDENNLHSLNRYAYANNNPYKFVDPDGQAAETVIDVISLGLSIKAWRQDPSFVNALAVAYDGLATAVPVLPGGIGIIRQASSKGGEITQAVRQAADGGAAKAGEGAKKKIVIGENMERVREAAKKVGAETFEGKGWMRIGRGFVAKSRTGMKCTISGPISLGDWIENCKGRNLIARSTAWKDRKRRMYL